ncbi:MAG: ABC transporter permease [Eubacteriales bacterium]
MHKYIAKRLLLLIPVLMGVLLIVYLILYLTPGDITSLILGTEYTDEAAAILRANLGLDKPFLAQYFDYIFTLCQGSFGNSYFTGEPIINEIRIRLPNTLKILVVSMIFCIVLSIPIGVQAAAKPNSPLSAFSTIFALLGLATPNFWLGLMMILCFSLYLGWLPSAGLDTTASIIMPAITVGTGNMAGTMRITRASMQESIRQDYVRTARSKGLRKGRIIYRHALPNALLPTITVIGMDIGYLIGGAVLTETVFSIPGIGRMMVTSIQQRDTPSVLACILIMSAGVGLASLAVDIVYAMVDPRIKAKYVSGGKV